MFADKSLGRWFESGRSDVFFSFSVFFLSLAKRSYVMANRHLKGQAQVTYETSKVDRVGTFLPATYPI